MQKGLKLAAVFAAAVAAVTLAGCEKPPISQENTANPEIQYDVLFNRHGCEVGRFYDNGHAVYVTMCPDQGTSSASYDQSCGKNCTETKVNEQVRAPQTFQPQAPN